ncbi:MAG: serine/threonine protein kinase [Micromonosporaceae bacterium]
MLTPGKSMGGRYRLDERIATGGMGDVWKCEDTVLGRAVALKVLQPAMLEEPGFAERFRAEARVMATINHPGVVQVYDYGENGLEGGGTVAYLVMEYVEGEPLHQVLGNVGRLAPARVMDLTAQAADALQAAHDRGIIHRDVKPGNLLMRPNGKLVLTDFGIARSAMTGNLTQVGAVLGTASYVSPEQATGTGDITPASDIYSLGVVAYQCLAGRRPFEGENPIEVAMKHVRDEPPPLPQDVPDPARAVVSRAMAKDMAARWPDARSMGEAAREAAAGRSVAGGAAAAAAGAAAAGAATTMIRPTSPAGPGDGTSVLPAAGGPPPGHPGQYRRGAASVPTGAPGDDDFYPTAQKGGYGGGYGGDDYPSGGHRPRKKGRGGLIVAAVAGVLALALGIGLVAWLASSGGTPNTKNSPTADKLVALNEEDYLNEPVDNVVNDLKDQGFTNVKKEKREQDGFQPNTVNGVDPSDKKVSKDTLITVYYQPKPQGGQMPTMPGGGNDGDGDNGGGDNGGGDNTPTGDPTPSETEPSESPTGSTSPGPLSNDGTTSDDTERDD